MSSEGYDTLTLSEFALHHQPRGEVFVSRSLSNEFDAVNYVFFLDYVLGSLSDEEGMALVRRIQDRANRVYRGIVEDGEIPHSVPAKRTLTPTPTKELLLSEESVSAFLQLTQHSDGSYCSTITVRPKDGKIAQQALLEGIETIFFEILEQGTQQTQHLLAVLLLAQCSWYLDNGLPTYDSLGKAPRAATQFIQELTNWQ